MPTVPTEIKSLARVYTDSAIKTLVGIMQQPKSPSASRVAAATVLLDRGWGKPAQAHAGADGEGPVEVIARIERLIVDPSNPDG